MDKLLFIVVLGECLNNRELLATFDSKMYLILQSMPMKKNIYIYCCVCVFLYIILYSPFNRKNRRTLCGRVASHLSLIIGTQDRMAAG